HQPPTAAYALRRVLNQHVMRAERVIAVDLHARDDRDIPPHPPVKNTRPQAVHLVKIRVVELLRGTNSNRCMHDVLLARVRSRTQKNLWILDRHLHLSTWIGVGVVPSSSKLR